MFTLHMLISLYDEDKYALYVEHIYIYITVQFDHVLNIAKHHSKMRMYLKYIIKQGTIQMTSLRSALRTRRFNIAILIEL